MSVFKCKMCGGDMDVDVESFIGVCQFCNSTQTIPRLDDEKAARLYERANHFRRRSEFDKAAAVYEAIVHEAPDDAEAYWSLVLCRFGIEYVEDPATGQRKPTCHRAQYVSIFQDENYTLAIQKAAPEAREVLEREAAAIDAVQKGILDIAAAALPYDVFICYKENGQDGKERTLDSVIAQDIHEQLERKGIRTFFARISLEDKLGTAYEPLIFAALQSAKVMLVVATKVEHVNAVWVRNEWGRFLKLMQGGSGKVLIPVYKNIDPYDLPDEFAHLQAADFAKVGAMQDLVRGVEKILGESKTPAPRQEIGNDAVSPLVAPLVTRMRQFLDDEDFAKAAEYCERILDIDPENRDAHLGRLLSEMKAGRIGRLEHNAKYVIDRHRYFVKAVETADETTKDALTAAAGKIRETLAARQEEELKRRAAHKSCEIGLALLCLDFDRFWKSGQYDSKTAAFCGYPLLPQLVLNAPKRSLERFTTAPMKSREALVNTHLPQIPRFPESFMASYRLLLATCDQYDAETFKEPVQHEFFYLLCRKLGNPQEQAMLDAVVQKTNERYYGKMSAILDSYTPEKIEKRLQTQLERQKTEYDSFVAHRKKRITEIWKQTNITAAKKKEFEKEANGNFGASESTLRKTTIDDCLKEQIKSLEECILGLEELEDFRDSAAKSRQAQAVLKDLSDTYQQRATELFNAAKKSIDENEKGVSMLGAAGMHGASMVAGTIENNGGIFGSLFKLIVTPLKYAAILLALLMSSGPGGFIIGIALLVALYVWLF